jgi:hypothetical protein
MGKGKCIPSFVAYPAVWAVIVMGLLVLIEGAASWALAVRSVAFREPVDLHTRYGSLRGWSSAPGKVVERAYGSGAAIRINSLGFSGEEVTHDVPEGRVRVVCSGDSFTFGEGVGNGQDWCHRLSELNEDVEPVNMGQSGYGIDQAYLWYSRDGVPLNPDVHVFAFVSGDFHRMLTSVRYGVGKPVLRVAANGLETRNVPVPRLRHTMGRAVDRADLRLVRLGSGFRHRLASPRSTTPQVEIIRPLASLLFQHLRDINSRDEVATLFVYLPTQLDLDEDPPVRDMARALTDELGVSFVDLTPLLRALPARQAAQMFLPDGHYNMEWKATGGSRRSFPHAWRRPASGLPGVG